MNSISTQNKKYIQETFYLTGKTLYKTVTFQLIFKIFYVGIIVSIFNFTISSVLQMYDLFIDKIEIGKTIQQISVITFFDFKVLLALGSSLFIFLYIYLVEKNGIVIITSEYYRNNFITFHKALLLSIQKTFLFIYRRLIEMRVSIFVFILFFLLWRLLSLLTHNFLATTFFGALLLIYGGALYLTLLLRSTYTAYITCLQPQWSTQKFNANISFDLVKKRMYFSFILYLAFFVFLLLWALIFYIMAYGLFALVTLLPFLISAIISLFIAFTIFSILIVFSVFKTFKIGLMTIFYYIECSRQNKIISTPRNQSIPFLSENAYIAAVIIFFMMVLGSIILMIPINVKTQRIIDNAQEYQQELYAQQTIQTKIEDLTTERSVEDPFVQRQSTIDTVEHIIFTYLLFIIHK